MFSDGLFRNKKIVVCDLCECAKTLIIEGSGIYVFTALYIVCPAQHISAR